MSSATARQRDNPNTNAAQRDSATTRARLSVDDLVAVLLSGGHLPAATLLKLAGDLLGRVEVELSNAPAAARMSSTPHGKPGSATPTAVPPDCACRCASPLDHAQRDFTRALERNNTDDLTSWIVATFYRLRPHPARAARRDELGIEFERRVIDRYELLAPEVAAAAEGAINPGTTGEQIRRVRKAHARHRETGVRVPEQSAKPEAARLHRADGMTLEQVAAALDCSVGSARAWTR